MRGRACLFQKQDLDVCASVCVQDLECHFDTQREYADEPQKDASLAVVVFDAPKRAEVGVNSHLTV